MFCDLGCKYKQLAPLFKISTNMETIHFYNYNFDYKVINKNLSSPTDFDCTLWKTFDILHPVLLVRLQAPTTFNYCKIDSLKRFYFVDSVKFIGNSTYEIFLSVDVLKTYETEILQAKARVVETEKANPYISIRENIYNRIPNFEKVEFPNKKLLDENGQIVMITLQGSVTD